MSQIDYEYNEFHTLQSQETANLLQTDASKGLDDEKFQARKSAVGENSLGDDMKIDYKAMLIHQICNAMILVLFISMIISFSIHDWITGGVISFVAVSYTHLDVYKRQHHP